MRSPPKCKGASSFDKNRGHIFTKVLTTQTRLQLDNIASLIQTLTSGLHNWMTLVHDCQVLVSNHVVRRVLIELFSKILQTGLELQSIEGASAVSRATNTHNKTKAGIKGDGQLQTCSRGFNRIQKSTELTVDGDQYSKDFQIVVDEFCRFSAWSPRVMLDVPDYNYEGLKDLAPLPLDMIRCW
ncbi:hypothetical protein GOP47_0009494 [Adiantum capillus-veneris]|uniref:Uncharacterized protein n=1 Tax=Adiantum capillus-veneris TaxID=13818 RepID=A0A9D4UWN9_ADICA|nr:hypothetical protein GOP47_0009494 [Adiantum capillus-veneris]